LRHELIERRAALPRSTLDEYRRRIDTHLRRAFPDLVHGVIAFCWPYRNEYDARHLLADLRRHGATTALPAIVAPKTPLVFREWHPGVALVPGPLGIPFPPDSPALQPDSCCPWWRSMPGILADMAAAISSDARINRAHRG
jgi:5,10-methenyltetrahydrofolate synthetase